MRALRIALPAVLVVALLALGFVLLDDAALGVVTGGYAWVLYGGGAVFAAIFHRSRVVTGLLGLAYLDLARGGALGEIAFVPFATAFMAVLAWLSLTRDRGVASRMGMVQIAVGLGLLALAHQVLRDPVAVAELEGVRLLPTGPAAWTRLPEITLVTALLAILISAYGVARWRGSVERALLGAQILVLVALLPGIGALESSLVLMGAGLLLALSVIEQSYAMAYRDELTGLPARRALMQDLADLSPPFAVAMVDVDHFKKFNDDHGHDVGDQVLQLVATRLAGFPEIRAYRYGGEEFTLIFPKMESDEAATHAEKVRAAVEEATFSLRSWRRPRKLPDDYKKKEKKRKRTKTLSVTVSIGLSDTNAGDPAIEPMLKRADQALYRAKEAGRNRVGV